MKKNNKKTRRMNRVLGRLKTKFREYTEEEDKLIFETRWTQLRKKFGWYDYLRHKNKDGVAVLCFNSETRKILVRYEHCPCHVEEKGELIRTAITGSIESETPIDTAIRELKEEAGVSVKRTQLWPLGIVYPSKFMDYKQHLFAVDIAGMELKEPKGDGTLGEMGAYVEWFDPDNIYFIPENTIGNCLFRLRSIHGVDLLNKNKYGV